MSFILNDAISGRVAYTGFEKPLTFGELYGLRVHTGVQWVLLHWQSLWQPNLSKMPTLWYSEQPSDLEVDKTGG